MIRTKAEHTLSGMKSARFDERARITILAAEDLAIDIQRCGHVGGHLHERLLRRAHIDCLLVAVEHQYNRSVEHVVHSSSSSVDS
jgi:hypothetical protein